MNPTIQALVDTVAAQKTVVDSAVAYITGVPSLITAAVEKALAGGATAEQLAPINEVVTQLQSETEALKAALTANTPQA